jgi:hypothetical protein
MPLCGERVYYRKHAGEANKKIIGPFVKERIVRILSAVVRQLIRFFSAQMFFP